jgi:hypothetical protein
MVAGSSELKGAPGEGQEGATSRRSAVDEIYQEHFPKNARVKPRDRRPAVACPSLGTLA